MKGPTIFFTCTLCAFTINATTIHVPADQPTIQAGIDASSNGDTVLVQPGIYVENINFNGHNIVLGSRFLTTGDISYISSTIIDGDSSGSVVTFENEEDSGAVIIGFTIQNGYTELTSPSFGYGGGIFCNENTTPVISNNIIKGNSANNSGGGISCRSSHPTIIYNTIKNNSIHNIYWGDGGGIHCFSSTCMIANNIIDSNFCYGSTGGISCFASHATIVNNTITGNSTFGAGGGVLCHHSDLTIRGNIISGNSSIGRGGGIVCFTSNPMIENNIISHNTTGFHGGGIANMNSYPVIANNTIFGNMAYGNGGGIYCIYGYDHFLYSHSTINNTIVWANTAAGEGDEIYAHTSTSPVITCCDIRGGWEGEGNIDADPLFCDPSAGDFHIFDNSPCNPANNSCGTLIGALGAGCTCCVARGNVDGDSGVNVADLTYLVDFLFFGGGTPPCPEEGNVDADGGINVADLTYLVDYLFFNGPAPPPCP